MNNALPCRDLKPGHARLEASLLTIKLLRLDKLVSLAAHNLIVFFGFLFFAQAGCEQYHLFSN